MGFFKRETREKMDVMKDNGGIKDANSLSEIKL